jgi:hypothetical protein
VAQQQLGEPLPGAHQIATHVLSRAHEIAQRLLLDARYPHRVQRVAHQEPQHPLGVTGKAGRIAAPGSPQNRTGGFHRIRLNQAPGARGRAEVLVPCLGWRCVGRGSGRV